MADYDLVGANGLRKYVWQLLQDELGWSAADYGGLTPITTPQQQPEFQSLGKKYIVYTYSKNPSTLFLVENEIVTFTIYATTALEIQEVINLLSTKLNKRDDSAKELNSFIAATQDARYNEFDYKAVWMSSAQGAQPMGQEGGFSDGYVNINIRYTHLGQRW